MISSDEEAFSLLKKWKSERSLMRFLLAFTGGGGSFTGRVADVTRSTVRLVGDDLKAEFTISLLKARFDFADSRQATAELFDKAEQFDASLTALLPGDVRLRFLELRN